MKKLLASLLAVLIFSHYSIAQNKGQQSLGVSFWLNDFGTAQKIRNSNLEKVLREKSWSKMRDMSPGLGLTYFRNLHPNIDFAGTLAASFLTYPFRNKPLGTEDELLLEADASVNLKMFGDDYWVSPYLIAGIGASKYKSYYGAIIPVGAGLKVNLFEEASLFTTLQYRIGLTTETTNYHFVYSFGVAGKIGK